MLFALFIISGQSHSQITKMWDKTILEQQGGSKTQWFQDAKFGMFIHWGLYSKLAGNGRTKGITE